MSLSAEPTSRAELSHHAPGVVDAPTCEVTTSHLAGPIGALSAAAGTRTACDGPVDLGVGGVVQDAERSHLGGGVQDRVQGSHQQTWNNIHSQPMRSLVES